jgi:hypothetical protein
MAVDGTGSNADAIGARVYIDATVNGETSLRQVGEVSASSTFLAMNSLDLGFGVGRATQIDRITIRWPSGLEQVLEKVAANQVLDITEPGAQ